MFCSVILAKKLDNHRFLSELIVADGLSELKTKLPATSASAPASANNLPVSRFTPPSISIKAFEPLCWIRFFSFFTFSMA
jgi:hypothetical protein